MLPRTVDGLSVVVALKQLVRIADTFRAYRSEFIKSRSMADSFSEGRGTDG